MSDDEEVRPTLGGVLGVDEDGEPVREPRASAPIWTTQVRKWIVRPPEEGQSAPRAAWETVLVLENQPWGEPDPAMVAGCGEGRYEWRMRTTRAIAGQVRMARRGEFAPHVPEDASASGQFNITKRQAEAAGSRLPADQYDEDLEPVPSPVRRIAREQPAAVPLSADMIVAAVKAAMAPAAPQAVDVAAIVKQALEADRATDLRALVASLKTEVDHLKGDRASAADFKSLQTAFTSLDHAFARKSNEWDAYGPAIASLEKKAAKETKPPSVEEELDRITRIGAILGLKKGGESAPAPVGRTGIDLAADMGSKLLNTVDGALRTKGIIRDDPLVRGRKPKEETSTEPEGDEDQGDAVAINWTTFRKGAYRHVGPFVERLADDMVGEVRIPLEQLVNEAVVRLHQFPAECETLLGYDPGEVRDLVAYAKGWNHPLVTSWTKEDEDFVAAFQDSFRDKLAKIEEIKQRKTAEAEAAKGKGKNGRKAPPAPPPGGSDNGGKSDDPGEPVGAGTRPAEGGDSSAAG
jgi:hypothetical protein